jgi:hypothetical protein
MIVEPTDKQKRFIEEYLVDLNATQAAIRAGYSEKTAHAQGSRLRGYPVVRDAIDEALSEKTAAAKSVCSNCVFLHASTNQCRVGRPSIGGSGKAAWPVVKMNDWCGEGDFIERRASRPVKDDF